MPPALRDGRAGGDFLSHGVSLASRSGRSSGEQQQEGDQQGEDAERFRHGETEDQAAELAVRGGGIAQGALQELTEQVADADGGGSVPMAARPAPMSLAAAGSMKIVSLLSVGLSV